MSTGPRDWFIAIVLIVCLPVLPRAGAQQGPANVVASPVVERLIAPQQSFVATTIPSRRTKIGSAVPGRVLEYPVEAGQMVAQGELLTKLRTKSIELEVAAAEAELELRAQELEELRAGTRPEEILQARAREASAKALHDYAKTRYDRTRQLFEQGQRVSRDSLDSAQSSMIEAEQALIDFTKARELAEAGPRQEQILQAEARKNMQFQQVELLKDRLEKYTIRAPFDGFVVTEFTEVGAWVQQSEPVIELIDIDPIELEVFVPEQLVRFIHPGTECAVTLAGFDEPFPGEVAFVVPQADVRSRTFPVRVRVDNRRHNGEYVLRAGMLAQVSLPVAEPQKKLLVPKDALVLGRQTVVYVIRDGKAVSVQVAHGLTSGSMIAVSGPLKPGEAVVVRGNERLRPDTPVKVVERRDENGKPLGDAAAEPAPQTASGG